MGMIGDHFQYAWEFLMDLEGWGEDHHVQGDPGGRTIWGISENNHPDMFRNGPPDEKQAQRFVRRVYWNPLRLGEVENPKMAAEILEFAYHTSTPERGRPVLAVRIAQRSVNDVHQRLNKPKIVVDGLIGPQTLGALNDLGTNTVESMAWDGRFNLHQLKHYRDGVRGNLSRQFFRGWSRRVVA